MGGTFDLFHKGHQGLIEFAFKIGDFVSIGVVSDRFANKLGKKPYQKFESRQKAVKSFLNKREWRKNSKLIKIDDQFGNSIYDETIDTLVATAETKRGAQTINSVRRSRHLPPLEIKIFDWVKSGDLRISSTLIREGVINSDGFDFRKFLSSYNFNLPTNLRPQLSKSYGTILKRMPNNLKGPIIIVGDQTTYDFLRHGLTPFLSIIDLRIQRETIFPDLSKFAFKRLPQVKNAKNGSGEISAELSKNIINVYEQKIASCIVVDGEEDLATIPAVLLAPIPSRVYYGLRGVGVVDVNVDLHTKDIFLKLLCRFDRTLVA